jgi:hypothetical protein
MLSGRPTHCTTVNVEDFEGDRVLGLGIYNEHSSGADLDFYDIVRWRQSVHETVVTQVPHTILGRSVLAIAEI